MSLSCFQAALSKRKEIAQQSNLYMAGMSIQTILKHRNSEFCLFQSCEF